MKATVASVTMTTNMNISSRRTRRLRSSFISCPFLPELIANAVDRLQVDRLVGRRFNLLTQVHHVHIYGTLESIVIHAKDALHQFQTAKSAPWLPGKRFQQAKLFGGQVDTFSIVPYFVRALINQPALLLADEPTGNLDSRTSDEILA